MPQSPRSTRERIIKAASHLFYTEGIGGVSVDAVAERARVTKRTLYYHFASKDDLVTAYLEGRDQPNLELMAGWFRDAEGDLADKVAVIFTHLALAARHPKWKGCAFLRTVAELAAMPGHPAVKLGARHKLNFVPRDPCRQVKRMKPSSPWSRHSISPGPAARSGRWSSRSWVP